MHKTTQHDTRCPEKKLEAIRAPQYLRHQDVVDWDVDELDEETNEPHDEKPNGGGFGHLHELCAEANGIEDRGNCRVGIFPRFRRFRSGLSTRTIRKSYNYLRRAC